MVADDRDRLGAHRPAARVDAVVADVVQRPAAELRPAPNVLRARDGEGEEAAHEPQLADRAAAQALEHEPAIADGSGT